MKSLIARMNVFLDFEGLNSIKEDLSSNFDFLGKEKFLKKSKNFVWLLMI